MIPEGKDRLHSTEILHRDGKLGTWRNQALTSAMRLMFKYQFDTDNMIDSRQNVNIGTCS